VLGAAHRVDVHAGTVGGIPHFELRVQVQGYVAKRATLEPSKRLPSPAAADRDYL
jgi:hypothetical protein